jgi:uncharacterized damage-inducible protein DinB
MTSSPAPDHRYPIGRFEPPAEYTPGLRAQFIAQIAEAPSRLREAVRGLDAQRMRTPYRDGGWTVAQTVHHVADSHLNAYARFKLALTEEAPTIKPYSQEGWARQPDAMDADVEVSLVLLEALHRRWVTLLRSLTPEQFQRVFVHPEMGRVTLDRTLGLYAWHGRHHTAHITALRARMGW